MRLTTKGRYAVTAMLDLALQVGDSPVGLSDIASRQAISLSYLEQLFSKLRTKGLVASIRGPGGGYRLNQPAANISIAQVINAVDESMDATRCLGSGNCHKGDRCLTHHLWEDLSAQIHCFLHSISLQELLERQETLEVAKKQNMKAKASLSPDCDLIGVSAQ